MNDFQVLAVIVGYVVILTTIVWSIIMRDDDFPKENDK